MTRFGSNKMSSQWVCISLYIMSKQSVSGIDGYKLSTLMLTRITLSGMVNSLAVG